VIAAAPSCAAARNSDSAKSGCSRCNDTMKSNPLSRRDVGFLLFEWRRGGRVGT
jgi:hypothetical protein